jgi:WD40 repeat protein
VSPDGQWVVSGSGDKTLRIWDVGSRDCVRKLDGLTDSVTAVAVSPDGQWVVFGSGDKTLRIWDVGLGESVQTLQGNVGWDGGTLAVSPDGRRVVWGGGYPETVRIWDVGSGEHVRALAAHTWSTSYAVTVSPDSNWVVSGSADGTMRVWDIWTGKFVSTLQGHTHWVRAVAVSPDGRWVVSGSDDGTVRVWELDWEYEFPEPVDWDEGALPYLEIFLTLHTPYGPDGLSRRGVPSWSVEDFQQLLTELGWRGYGWLRPEGMRVKLEELAVERGWHREV